MHMGPKYVLLFLTAFYLSETMARGHDTKIYCGKQLSSTLSTVCKGDYNTLNKRPPIYIRRNWEAQYTEDRNLNYPYRSRASATSLMTQFRRRRKRGVYNECCEKACSYDELKSYCGSSSGIPN